MVVVRLSSGQPASLDDGAVSAVVEAAAQVGGADEFPILFSLFDSGAEVDPLGLLDELARLAAADAGGQVAMLTGALRDDLMEEMAAAEEG